MFSNSTREFAAIAREAYGYFETRERADGTPYVSKMDDAPEWVAELVRSAHGNMLPDDWRYATIRNALSYLDDADVESEDDAQDAMSEFADSNTDVYTSDLLAWLGSHSDRVGYCDEARETFGSDDSGILAAIQRGQYVESEEVFASVVSSLSAQVAR